MNTPHILYSMARADFLERTRRYSFLIMLGLVLYLGYSVNAGQITLRLDTYRGIFNSAWVGSMMTLVVNFFLGWFGFYLIKNAITRDYETRVGQIIATTPLSRPIYLLGKWLSNFAVLSVMVVLLMIFAVAMQLLMREEAQINLWALVAPFLFVALPFMALTAAFAVLFESIGWLRGGFGNLVYFFFFISAITVLTIIVGPKVPLLDWIGFGLFSQSMGDAARAVYPNYQDGFSLGLMPPVDMQTFYWVGVSWTVPVILTRLVLFAFAAGVALTGSLFFDRFDSARWRASNGKRRREKYARMADVLQVEEPITAKATMQVTPKVILTPLPVAHFHFRFGRLLLAELYLLLKGQRWWWYVVALGLIIACAVSPIEVVRQGLLSAAWIWPVLIWSKLGCREAVYDTRQMVFSSPQLLLRQLPAMWIAGVVVALLMGSGAAVNMWMHADYPGMLSLLVGALFVPSLALMSGIWMGSNKTFEIIYVLLWYLGPVNKLGTLDYSGGSTGRFWLVYLVISLLFVCLSFFGRARQLRKN